MRSISLLLVVFSVSLLCAPVDAQGYVGVTNNGLLIEIDPATGAELGTLAQIPGVSQINAMARRPSDGALFFSHGWLGGSGPFELHRVVLDTNGQIQQHVILPYLGLPQFGIPGMAFDSDGVLHAINWGAFGAELITINTTTGACASVGPGLGLSNNKYTGLAWDEVNGHFIGWHLGAATNPPGPGTGSGLVHIDRATGIASDPGPLQQATNSHEVQGLGFDRDGNLISVGWQWPLQHLDPATGAVLWASPAPIMRYLRGIEDIRAWLHLALGGTCPGQMTVELSNGTANGQAAIAYSFSRTGFTIPTGPCAGTTVRLGAPATVLGIVTLNAQGAYVLGPMNVPGVACGNVYVQAIDLTPGVCVQTAAVLL
jgi:hypothetical protein